VDGVSIRQYNSLTSGVCYDINSDDLHSVVFEMKSVRIERTVQYNIYQHCCKVAGYSINSDVTSG